VKFLADAGLTVGVIASPVLPLITDSEENLELIARSAKAAGATSFGANVLFLKPCSRRVFFPFLEDQFPHLAARYRANYEHEAFLRGAYPQRIREMVQAIRVKHGLVGRDMSEVPHEQEPQLRLF
jgi:DNA repair photolyase